MTDKAYIPYLIAPVSAFIGWLFTFFYHRRVRKNDLEYKLFKQIEELSNKYFELTKKYIKLQGEFCILKKENKKLRTALETLVPNIDELEELEN